MSGMTAMKVFVLAALCFSVVVDGSDPWPPTEPDIFCRAITIFLNPVIQNCQTLMNETDSDTFCASSCSQLLAQALYDCGDSSYAKIQTLCARDPVSSQLCDEVKRNETIIASLNSSCSLGSENCSEECQAAIDNTGCCVKYIGSYASVDQCNVRNCTNIEISTTRAEALKCYRSSLQNTTFAECHEQLIKSTLSLDEATTTLFCDGSCPSAVASRYSECGLSNFASIIEQGCTKDERGLYCGNVVHNSDTEALVEKAILACNQTDCSSGVCEAAIDEIGCCLALDAEVNVTLSTILPISNCEVKHCPTFSSALQPVIQAGSLAAVIGTLFLARLLLL